MEKAETFSYSGFKENWVQFDKTKKSIKPFDTYALFADGACRSNPGETAAGYVIYDSMGAEVYTNSLPLKRGTNNTAEYYGVIFGIRSALNLGVKNLEVFTDSELVARQVKGQWQVKEKLKSFHDEVVNLINKFASCEVKWISRDENEVADSLAKNGLELQEDSGSGKMESIECKTNALKKESGTNKHQSRLGDFFSSKKLPKADEDKFGINGAMAEETGYDKNSNMTQSTNAAMELETCNLKNNGKLFESKKKN